MCAIAAVFPAVLSAQEPPPETSPERERVAVVGIWDPSPIRIGLLIPVNDRWVIRPDLSGNAYDSEGAPESWTLSAGVSLLRRSVPTEVGYGYLATRIALSLFEPGGGQARQTGYQLSAGAGAHARVTSVLGIFGEAGITYTYVQEADATTTIDRSVRVATRFGFAISRPGPRN